MSDPGVELAVVHDRAARQFRAGAGEAAAVLQYSLSPGQITFLHTLVPETLRGRGLAQRLAQAGLEHAKIEELRVVPICPFVRAYLERYPEYRALVER